MKKVLLVAGAVLLLLVAALFVIGWLLPRQHVARQTAVYGVDPKRIWAILTDYEKAPEWRTGLERVEVLEPVEGRLRYRETTKFGPVTYQVEVAEPPHRLRGRIVDEDLGWGGTWTWELSPEDGGTRVTITERGTIDSALFRTLARYVFGYHKTMDVYLRDLGRRVGESVEPQPAPVAEEERDRPQVDR